MFSSFVIHIHFYYSWLSYHSRQEAIDDEYDRESGRRLKPERTGDKHQATGSERGGLGGRIEGADDQGTTEQQTTTGSEPHPVPESHTGDSASHPRSEDGQPGSSERLPEAGAWICPWWPW